MMEALRDWAFAVCAAAVAGSLVKMLAPGGATEKLLGLTVSLFFLCALLSPILTGALDGEFTPPPAVEYETEYRTQELEERLKMQTERSFVSSMENAVRAVLKEKGAEAREIFINISTEGQDSISITEVRVVLDSGEQGRQGELSRVLEETTGQKPVLEFLEESAPAGG